MPKESDDIIGGLSGIICGYIEKRKMLIVFVGISKKCGDKGYIYIPYDYIKSIYQSELWIIELEEELIMMNFNEKINNNITYL